MQFEVFSPTGKGKNNQLTCEGILHYYHKENSTSHRWTCSKHKKINGGCHGYELTSTADFDAVLLKVSMIMAQITKNQWNLSYKKKSLVCFLKYFSIICRIIETFLQRVNLVQIQI